MDDPTGTNPTEPGDTPLPADAGPAVPEKIDLNAEYESAGIAEVTAKVEVSGRDWITPGIVEFLKRVGWASPRDIRGHLDVAQRTCTRRLQALLASGVLESRGFTTGVQYRIRTTPLQAPSVCGAPVSAV